MPPHPRRHLVQALAFSVYAAYGLSWAAAGPFLKTFMADLGLGLAQASLLTTSATCARVAGPFVAGALLPRLGLHRTFLGGAILIAAGGLVPLLPWYAAMLAARFAMGLGAAVVVVCFTPLAMRWFPERERLVVNGLNYVSASVGTVAALLATPWLQASLDGSWRATLAVYSILSLILALAWFGLAPSLPAPSEGPAPASSPSSWASLAEALRDRHTWRLIWAGIGPLASWVAIVTFFPTFYSERFGAHGGWWASHAAALPLLAGIPSSLAGIVLARRLGRRLPLLRTSYGLSLPLLVAMFALPAAAVPWAALLTGVALFLPMPAFYTIPQELPGATPERAAAMMACFWALCYGATTCLMWGAGRVAESHGLPGGLALIASVALVSALGLFFLPETGPGGTPAAGRE